MPSNNPKLLCDFSTHLGKGRNPLTLITLNAGLGKSVTVETGYSPGRAARGVLGIRSHLYAQLR